MAITVRIHVELAAEGPIWWADSADLPGFTAADNSMQAVITRARLAIGELTSEGEDAAEPVKFEMVADEYAADTSVRVHRTDTVGIPASGSKTRVIVAA